MSARIAVVILNYNGKHFLEKFLPAVIQHSGTHNIYVADNASTDNSAEFVRAAFPGVKMILNEKNLGYAQGYNEALKNLPEDYFVLLNSDVEVSAGWLDPMLNLLDSDKRVGACQPKLLDYNRRNFFEYAGASGGYIDKYCYPFCRGRLFNTLEEDKGQYNDGHEIFWASGACLFVRSEAFRKAGGLDGDFFAHMEEIDLCWRMKNLGYSIFIEPSSVVYHVGGGTLNKVSPRKTFLNFRNNLITLTKNHPSKGLVWKFIVRLVLDGIAGLKFLLAGEPLHCWAVIKAHFAFYFSFSATMTKRKSLKTIPGFKHCTSQVYMANVVTEYFLKGKRKFSDLDPALFKKD